jgi:hypothetical protein
MHTCQNLNFGDEILLRGVGCNAQEINKLLKIRMY